MGGSFLGGPLCCVTDVHFNHSPADGMRQLRSPLVSWFGLAVWGFDRILVLVEGEWKTPPFRQATGLQTAN